MTDQQDPSPTSPIRVLVVEDEPLVLMDMEFYLSDAGFEVLTARSCDQGNDVLSARVPDVAVLDVNLGRGETCEPLARRLADVGVPFLLHTGDLERRGEMVVGLNAPIIAKPSLPDDVIAAIRSLVASTRG